PGIAELAALLACRLADRLMHWDRARVARGREPLAWPLKIRTHTVLGHLLLRTLAATRALRPHGSRYAAEQAMIERWLAGVGPATATGKISIAAIMRPHYPRRIDRPATTRGDHEPDPTRTRPSQRLARRPRRHRRRACRRRARRRAGQAGRAQALELGAGAA